MSGTEPACLGCVLCPAARPGKSVRTTRSSRSSARCAAPFAFSSGNGHRRSLEKLSSMPTHSGLARVARAGGLVAPLPAGPDVNGPGSTHIETARKPATDPPGTPPAGAPQRTFGVEEEFLLVDPNTWQPVPVAEQALRNAIRNPRTGQGPVLGLEVKQEQLEVVGPVCSTLQQMAQAIRQGRAMADTAARAVGARAVALATSPLAGTPTVAKPASKAISCIPCVTRRALRRRPCRTFWRISAPYWPALGTRTGSLRGSPTSWPSVTALTSNARRWSTARA